MIITPIFDCVEGSFDTANCELHCIPDDNHGRVDLCIKEPGDGWYIPIGKIILHSKDLYKDFKATLPDATALGNEIARRWNECENKQ
jgi:hypothetical protein